MRFNCRNDLRWFLIRMLVILAPVTISGCVETLSSRHITAKQALLGKSESEVLACAEAPRTVSSQDRLRVLSYYKEEACSKAHSLEPKAAVRRACGMAARQS